MKEQIELLKNVQKEILEHIKFYKTFVDWKLNYKREISELIERNGKFKQAIKLLRGIK